MQPSTEENHNGKGGCAEGGPLQACACCAALAQLRMPWMDAAMQHAAPHYPYPVNNYPYPQHSYRTPQEHTQSFRESDENADEDDQESGTLFFKLPFLNKNRKNKKQNSRRKTRSGPKNKKTLDDSSSEPEKSSSKSELDENIDFVENSQKSQADSAGLDEAETAESNWHSEIPKAKKRFKLSFGLQGLAVSLFGILLPALVIACGVLSTPKRVTLVMLHHPLEAAVEFLLLAAMPVVNYLVWHAICKQRVNLSRWLVMALGAGIGTALVVSGICFAALFGSHEGLADAIGSDFSAGFTGLAGLSLLSGLISAYLANRLRLSWELQSSRLKVSIQAVTGMLLAILAFGAAEFRPWCIRLAQFNAVAKDDQTRKQGLAWLRQLNPEREMRMECSDSRAAGLPGLFFPIKSSAQHQLYFTLTGTPYSFRDEKAEDLASMSDDYLSRHVVGDKIPHFGLTRSNLDGVIHANTLTSTLNWTFVVKNANSYQEEMRAEIGLPVGAAVTGLTLWRKGESSDAEFVASGKIEGAASISAGGDTPAMITDLGRGRVLLHCYPVPAEEEMKVRVSMVVPLKSEADGQASLVTPQLIASNFDLDGEHSLRLRAKTALTSSVKGLESGSIPGGERTISGTLSSDQLENSPLVVTARREQIGKPYAVLDKLAMTLKHEDAVEKERLRVIREREKEEKRKQEEKEELNQVVLMIDGSRGVKTQLEDFNKILKGHKAEKKKQIKARVITIKPEYVLEDIKRVAAPAPKQLVVVIDGSETMKQYKGEIRKALSALPANIPTKVIIASQEMQKKSRAAQAQSLFSVVPKIEEFNFIGGQDNLEAVVKAAGLAGETKDSALLWIHGPQPVINQEIYIMSKYESTPTFYELP
ncbi:MAG: hypothetical protein K2X27_20065, partial [Candidatus Obscuribacterales bacterium]|nr:hypothetical protein [Candidatus Obscuribacterales bacterium]